MEAQERELISTHMFMSNRRLNRLLEVMRDAGAAEGPGSDMSLVEHMLADNHDLSRRLNLFHTCNLVKDQHG
jgi:hypothetical protein